MAALKKSLQGDGPVERRKSSPARTKKAANTNRRKGANSPEAAPEVRLVLNAVWRAADARRQAWRGADELGFSENSVGVEWAVTEGFC